MSLAYDASGVLDLCERVFRNDLELDCERSNERNTVRAKVSIGGTRYTIVCSAMEKAQVLHLWAFLPFDVESEEKAMQMANACKELNSIMVTGKYTYHPVSYTHLCMRWWTTPTSRTSSTRTRRR